MIWPGHFFAPYLVGYLFWLGIALGCIGLDNAASPGRRIVGTGHPAPARSRRQRPCPLLALLFLPIAFGIPNLYAWARPSGAEGVSTALEGAYLNESLFSACAAGYFGVWTVLAFLLCGWSSRQDDMSDHRPSRRLQRLERPGHRDPLSRRAASRRSTG